MTKMHSFVLLCSLAIAYATPTGYSYGPSTHPGSGGTAQLSPSINPVAPIEEYRKEYFSFNAPEHEFNDHGDAGKLANQLKKNLRVIFIKGPENNGLENAVVQFAKSANEDRTAIYVLSKQPDIADLANKLNTLNTPTAHKPEVHFVKYRTKEDADNAQHAIQTQYGETGGAGAPEVAKVLDFSSKPAAPVSQRPKAPVKSYLPTNTYLPPFSGY